MQRISIKSHILSLYSSITQFFYISWKKSECWYEYPLSHHRDPQTLFTVNDSREHCSPLICPFHLYTYLGEHLDFIYGLANRNLITLDIPVFLLINKTILKPCGKSGIEGALFCTYLCNSREILFKFLSLLFSDLYELISKQNTFLYYGN